MVHQEDGLPLIYREYPGSIVDITEASDMIAIINSLGYKDITVICDRGYISKENMEAFDEAGIHFLMMIRSNLSISKDLVREYGESIRLHSEWFLPEQDLYGVFCKGKM